jgi:hypothetical protein
MKVTFGGMINDVICVERIALASILFKELGSVMAVIGASQKALSPITVTPSGISTDPVQFPPPDATVSPSPGSTAIVYWPEPQVTVAGRLGRALAGVATNDRSELTNAMTMERCITRLGAANLVFTIPSSR